MLTRKEIFRRKWIMRRNGINITNDSSWGPRLNAMWLSLPISVRGQESFWLPVREELHDPRKTGGVHVVRDIVDGLPTGDYHYENDDGLIVDSDDIVDTKNGFDWKVKFKLSDPSVIDTLATMASDRYRPEYVSKPYDSDGVIHIKSSGKTNGATPSRDMLDAIIFSTARSGTDLKTNLGLSALESILWRTPRDLYGDSNVYNRMSFDHDITNNHAYYDVMDLMHNWLHALFNKYQKGYALPYNPEYVSAMRYFYEHPDLMKQYDHSYDIHDVLSDGFLRYRSNPGKWNSGLSNLVLLVTKRANELWSIPAILEYINSDHAKAVWQAGLDSRKEYPVESLTLDRFK